MSALEYRTGKLEVGRGRVEADKSVGRTVGEKGGLYRSEVECHV